VIHWFLQETQSEVPKKLAAKVEKLRERPSKIKFRPLAVVDSGQFRLLLATQCEGQGDANSGG
jgi:hypothetical protein